MVSSQLRRRFLEYFKKNGHTVVPSSPVIPHEDPTLLFINAGMNQFKDVFLGTSARDYRRATSSQKCIRVGGKHNDLENVGHTRRHLTFFEMLGNFSFGDYFKKEAIRFAWEVATEVFNFPSEKIWPTVFTEDDEAFELWTAYVSPEKITRFGESENFWAMGDSGPCGPCSELLLDRGESYGPATNPLQDSSGERFLEFWNLVFMQYNRQVDGSLAALPNPSIDTGAGLERVAMLRANVDSVYETDILASLISSIERVSGKKYDHSEEKGSSAFRVIADHLRSLSFAIADGVQPSNIDRGYVLRKILRRAVRYGRQLGLEKPFLSELLPTLIESMGSDYPELVVAHGRISEILTLEEESFIRTLKRGGNLLNGVVADALKKSCEISGEDAFKLKDTYGMPIEEIILIAKDNKLSIDLPSYQLLEQEAKERSRSSHKNVKQVAQENLFLPFIEEHGPSQFLGYKSTKSDGTIKAIVIDGKFASEIAAGSSGLIILDRTPFYAEMGGQVGDSGSLESDHALFCVADTLAPYSGIIGHSGRLERGILKVGEGVTALVDTVRRQQIANNHTATHLLHWALHEVLGPHIKQAGSLVDEHRLRFDFSHHKALSKEEMGAIEDLVNEKIRENNEIRTYELPYEEVQSQGEIKQFFGEKYGRFVRVVDAGYSKELCGGTHTTFVGTIGLFIIAKESSIAAGVRRIEAVTGQAALQLVRVGQQRLEAIALQLKTPTAKIEEKIAKLQEEMELAADQLKKMREQQARQQAQELLSNASKIKELLFIGEVVQGAPDEVNRSADTLIQLVGRGIVVLGCKDKERCHIAIRVSSDCIAQGHSAAELIKLITPVIEGSGGGKAASGQASGRNSDKLKEAIELIRQNINSDN